MSFSFPSPVLDAGNLDEFHFLAMPLLLFLLSPHSVPATSTLHLSFSFALSASSKLLFKWIRHQSASLLFPDMTEGPPLHLPFLSPFFFISGCLAPCLTSAERTLALCCISIRSLDVFDVSGGIWLNIPLCFFLAFQKLRISLLFADHVVPAFCLHCAMDVHLIHFSLTPPPPMSSSSSSMEWNFSYESLSWNIFHFWT